MTHPHLGQRDFHFAGHDLLLNGVGTGADIHSGTNDGESTVSLGGYHGPGGYLTSD
jgi:hypothetical protein